MSNVLLLTSGREPPADILPSLSLLPHSVRVVPAAAENVAGSNPAPDAVLIDGRRDLVQVRHLLRVLQATENRVPVIVIVTDGGWAAVASDWAVTDLLLHTAGPAEVEARLRLAIGRQLQPSPAQLPDEIRSSGLVINEATYSARMQGRALDLTFKEFELLKFLVLHPGRVFTRAQLLQEVWGYDYFGGTRTVDVHVRRLRAKLGPENEALIGTVRNVGYRFVPVKGASAGAEVVDRRGQPGELAGQADPGNMRAGDADGSGAGQLSGAGQVGSADASPSDASPSGASPPDASPPDASPPDASPADNVWPGKRPSGTRAGW